MDKRLNQLESRIRNTKPHFELLFPLQTLEELEELEIRIVEDEKFSEDLVSLLYYLIV